MARPKKCGKCSKPKRPRGKKFKDAEGYCECGKPTVMTPDTLQKLEDAFTLGLSDRKACAYAGISNQTLYNYQKENPEFVERKEDLKLRPDLKAQQTIVQNLGDPQHAWRWLEKKDKDFMPSSKVEHVGTVEVTDLTREMSDDELEALKKLREARRKRIEEASDKLP